jgi:hypothetical protein
MSSNNVYNLYFTDIDGRCLHAERVHIMTNKKWNYEALRNLDPDATFVEECWEEDDEDDTPSMWPMRRWLEQYCTQEFRDKLFSA